MKLRLYQYALYEEYEEATAMEMELCMAAMGMGIMCMGIMTLTSKKGEKTLLVVLVPIITIIVISIMPINIPLNPDLTVI